MLSEPFPLAFSPTKPDAADRNGGGARHDRSVGPVSTAPLCASFPSDARLIASARWPFARADMTEPGLVVWRLAEDMAELFDSDCELSVEALVALGWPRHLAAQYFEPASQHSAALVAAKLNECRRFSVALRQNAAIAVEPTEGASEQALALRRESASPSELRVFLFGMIGGGLIGALLAISIFSFAEALR